MLKNTKQVKRLVKVSLFTWRLEADGAKSLHYQGAGNIEMQAKGRHGPQ